jgi:flagellar secretion chaperone FliS
MDIGGSSAEALSEFYASTFAQILQGSQAASRAKFEHAIACVRNVRDAWRQAAQESTPNPDSMHFELPVSARQNGVCAVEGGNRNWNA